MRVETANFILRCFGEDAGIEAIAGILEGNFERITNILGVVPLSQTNVCIYANQKNFHEAIGRPDAEAWVVGTVVAGEIHMVSPNNPGPGHTYDDIIKVAVHELVHIAAEVLSPDTTDNRPYLSEGLATYLAGQYKISDIAGSIRQLRQSGNADIPCVDTIIGPEWGDYVYDMGFVFMHFIVSGFGHDGLAALYRDPDAFVLAHEGLNEMWMRFLGDNF